MEVAVKFAPSRHKKVTVEVAPANWQQYIAH